MLWLVNVALVNQYVDAISYTDWLPALRYRVNCLLHDNDDSLENIWFVVYAIWDVYKKPSSHHDGQNIWFAGPNFETGRAGGEHTKSVTL